MKISSPGSDNAASDGSLARIATATVFFVQGFLMANWVAHIPTVKNQLQITSSQLGVALLGIAVGAIMGMPAMGSLIARWGTRKVTTTGALLGSILTPVLLLAPNYPLLMTALVLYGATSAITDVAMNAQGVTVENRMGKVIMSSLHALFSIGGLAGSLFAVLMLTAGVSPGAHLVTAAALSLVLILCTERFLLPDRTEAHKTERGFLLPRGQLLLLGMLTFISLMTEGAIADWSALYMHQELEVKSEIVALGYAGFSLAMAVGRLVGDRLVISFGRNLLLRAGGMLAALGFSALLLENYLLAILGFICAGFGLSNIIPLLFSAAGNIKNVQPGVGIATVSGTGYIGFLVGPPLVGFLADRIGLTYALGMFVILMVFVVSAGKWVEHQNT